MGKPRILFLDQSGQLGGAELSLLDIATAFRSHCKVVTFAEGPFPQRLRDQHVDTEVIPLTINYTKRGAGVVGLMQLLPALRRAVNQVAKVAKDRDVICANTPKAALVAALAAKRARRPWVYHLRDLLTPDHFGGVNRRLLVWAARRARRVICNSNATREALLAAGGSAELTQVVLNGIDPEPYEAAPGQRESQRQALSLTAATLTILIAGRLTPWKGQHVLLEALERLPEALALVVGEALFTDEDRAYAEGLRALAQSPGLAGRVHFLGFREDMPSLYAAADVVVHCSTAPEPFGRVIVEGMLAGKPVIASDAGGAREILRHGETGLLVRPGDAAALAGALQRLCEDPELRLRLATAAREDAVNRFSLTNVIHQIEEILVEVTAA